jgi:hypothetical protein
VVAADGSVVDVVVLFEVAGAMVTTETESSEGVTAFPASEVTDNHTAAKIDATIAKASARCLYVAHEVTL